MASSVRTTAAKPFESKIPCAAMIFPPHFNFSRAWRHAGNRTDWLRSSFWSEMGQQLEIDGYDMLFIPDALAMPRGEDGTTDAVISAGSKSSIYLDPITVLSAVATVTKTLRLGGTISTSFVPAYDIARRMATLHQLSGGRAAWNIVTSAFDAEAQNMGLGGLEPKADRYRKAAQVTREVLAIWESFAEDALTMDRESGRFAEAAMIQPTDSGVGPLTLPGDVKGNRPMLLQAGASPTGRDFASRWADATFMVAGDSTQGQEIRADLRNRASQAGRNPDELTTLMAIQPIVAETSAAAEEKLQQLKNHIDAPTAWQDLANLFRADPTDWELDDSAADFLKTQRGATGAQGFENVVAQTLEDGVVTLGDLAVVGALAQFQPIVVGSTQKVAEHMQALVEKGATDGFMITGSVAPDSFTDFAPVIAQLNG